MKIPFDGVKDETPGWTVNVRWHWCTQVRTGWSDGWLCRGLGQVHD